MKKEIIIRRFMIFAIVFLALSGSSISASSPAEKKVFDFNNNDKCWSSTIEEDGVSHAESIISNSSNGILVGGTSLVYSTVSGKSQLTDQYLWLNMSSQNGKPVWGQKYREIKISAIPLFLELQDGVFISGYEEKKSPVGNEYYLVKAKIGYDGKIKWLVKDREERIGYADFVVQLPNGGFLMKHGKKAHHYDQLDNNGKLISRKTNADNQYAADLGAKFIKPSVIESIIAISGDDYPVYTIKKLDISDAGDILSEKVYKKPAGNYIKTLIAKENGSAIYAYNNEFINKKPVYDVTLVSADSKGKTIWEKKFGGAGNDDPVVALETSAHEVFVLGSTTSLGKCFDEDGNKDCEKSFMTIAGMDGKHQYPANIFILKTGSDGHEIWARVIGGPGEDTVRSAAVSDDGSIIAAGYYKDSSPDGAVKSFLMKIDGDGTCDAGTTVNMSLGKSVSSKKPDAKKDTLKKSNTSLISANNPKVDHVVKKEAVKKELYDIYVNNSCWVRKIPHMSWEGNIALSATADKNGFIAAYTAFKDYAHIDVTKPTLISFNPNGAIMWTSSMEGGFFDSVKSLSTGEILTAGRKSDNIESMRSESARNAMLTKWSREGNINWSANYPGVGARSIVELSDAHYAVTAVMSVDMFSFPVLTRIDKDGAEIWSSKIIFKNPFFVENRLSAVEESKGNVVIAGTYSQSEDPTETASLTLINSSGKIVKEVPYPYANGSDSPVALVRSGDDGYVMATTRNSFTKKTIYPGGAASLSGENFDVRVMKVDKKGGFLWDIDFGSERYDVANSLINTSDGGYMILATTSSEGPCYTEKLDLCDYRDMKASQGQLSEGTNIWLIKLSSTGKKEWVKTIGSSGMDTAGSVIQLADGSFILSGTSSKVFSGSYSLPVGLIIKIDEKGKCDLDLDKI